MSDALEHARALAKAWAAERRELQKALVAERRDLDRLAVAAADVIGIWRGIEEHVESGAGVAGLRTLVHVGLAAAVERLTAAGVTLDGKTGEHLDGQRHRVVSETVTPSSHPGEVVAVVTSGVLCNGRRLRPAEVLVHREGAQDGSQNRD